MRPAHPFGEHSLRRKSLVSPLVLWCSVFIAGSRIIRCVMIRVVGCRPAHVLPSCSAGALLESWGRGIDLIRKAGLDAGSPYPSEVAH